MSSAARSPPCPRREVAHPHPGRACGAACAAHGAHTSLDQMAQPAPRHATLETSRLPTNARPRAPRAGRHLRHLPPLAGTGQLWPRRVPGAGVRLHPGKGLAGDRGLPLGQVGGRAPACWPRGSAKPLKQKARPHALGARAGRHWAAFRRGRCGCPRPPWQNAPWGGRCTGTPRAPARPPALDGGRCRWPHTETTDCVFDR